jgi:hypothetical protein
MIVEVLHPRTGGVRARARVHALPFTIGRALDAALLLDDPHVDARHAQLVQDATGALVLEDLGSVNGLHTPAHERTARVAVASGTEVLLGRTRLRFRDEHDPVPAAIPLRGAARPGPARWHERLGVRLAFIAGTTAFIGAASWLGSDSRAGANEAVSLALGLLLLGALWAGIWAVVSRVVVHQARFVAHVSIAFLALLATSLIGKAGEWILFLFPAAGWWAGASGALMLTALAVMVQAHLAQATAMPPRSRWRAALAVAGAALVIAGAFALVEDDTFTDVPEFNGVIKAAPIAVVPTIPVEAFVTQLAELRDAVDSLAVRTRD